jgi:hypothetical protein
LEGEGNSEEVPAFLDSFVRVDRKNRGRKIGLRKFLIKE